MPQIASAPVPSLSSLSVGVHESEHTVYTVCPHCHKSHRVVMAANDAESTAMQSVLSKLTGHSYRARFPQESKRQLIRGTARASANESVQTIEPTRTETPITSRPRFRYYAADRRKNPDVLSPTRRKIYTVITRAHKSGVVAQDLLKRGFPHGTIQQTLHWLRQEGWVVHEEERVTV